MALVFGLLKGILVGGIIGGGIGYGWMMLKLGIAVLTYLVFGLIGALVGFAVGKPFWKHDTIWTPVFKAVFGFIVGVGLYALGHNLIGDLSLSFIHQGATLSGTTWILGGLVGIIYGVFVGLDESWGDNPGDKKKGGE